MNRRGKTVPSLRTRNTVNLLLSSACDTPRPGFDHRPFINRTNPHCSPVHNYRALCLSRGYQENSSRDKLPLWVNNGSQRRRSPCLLLRKSRPKSTESRHACLNVGCWGKSGSRFVMPRLLLLAISDHSTSVPVAA